MKKRILIVTVIATMLMTMLALPTFADEADDALYNQPPYYVATISVGDAFDYQAFTGFDDTYDGYVGITVTGNGTVEEMGSLYGGFFNGFSYGSDSGAIDTTLEGNGAYFYHGAEDDGVVVVGQNGVVVEIATYQEKYTQTDTTLTLYVSPWGYPDYSSEDENGDEVISWGEPVDYDPAELLACLRTAGFEVETYDPSRPSHLVPSIFEGFGAAIGGIAGGLKAAFNGVVYTDGTSGAFSPLVIFIFTMAGLTLAAGVLYKIFAVVRARKG